MAIRAFSKATGLFSRIKKGFFGGGPQSPFNLTGTIFTSIVPPEDANIPCNGSGYIKAYKENVWVRRCLNVRANNLSSVPIKLIEGKPTEEGALIEIPEHPILDLLQNVNDQTMNKIDLFRSTSLDIDIHGMAAWLVIKKSETLARTGKVAELQRRGRPANKGVPSEIYRLDPMRLEIVPSTSPGRFMSHYRYRVDKGAGGAVYTEYAEDEVVLFKVFNPEDEYTGLSLVHTVRKFVSTDINALNWNTNFFINAASPGNAIIYPDPLDQKQTDLIEEIIQKRHSGVGKHGGTLVLGGNPRFESRDSSPKDADWTSLSTINRDAICACTGVPVFLVSGNDSSRYDTADPQKASFWEESLLPELAWWSEILNWSLVKMYPDLSEKGAKLYFDPSDIPALKAVTLARYQKVSTATGVPFLSPDEGRAIIGKPPVKGGNKVLIPMGMIPIDSEDIELMAEDKVKGKNSTEESRHVNMDEDMIDEENTPMGDSDKEGNEEDANSSSKDKKRAV